MGGVRLIRLVEELGGIDAVVPAAHAELKRAGLGDATIEAFRDYDAGLLESDTEWLATPGHHLLTWDSDQYPALLRDNLQSDPRSP